MIKFDGYYLTEPLEVYDGRTKEKSSYTFNAYLFLKTGELKIKTKHDYLDHLSDFTESDFKEINSDTYEFRIEKNKIIIKPNSEFGNEYSLEFISENNMLINSTERKLVFIPWNKLNELSVDETNNAELIKTLFGPFYHKKYKVYYE